MHEARPEELYLQAVHMGDRLVCIKGKLRWVAVVGCEGCSDLEWSWFFLANRKESRMKSKGKCGFNTSARSVSSSVSRSFSPLPFLLSL